MSSKKLKRGEIQGIKTYRISNNRYGFCVEILHELGWRILWHFEDYNSAMNCKNKLKG